ncbi:MAG: hypothetical protein IPN89_14155 [Saprospiraceae bacterium]|nr:hypothetical protein [Saprospiraceae bacterium]
MPVFNGTTTSQLQGVGYGMIAQCKMPGNNTATFAPYGTKVSTGFNFSPNDATIPSNNPPYPFGCSTTHLFLIHLSMYQRNSKIRPIHLL